MNVYSRNSDGFKTSLIVNPINHHNYILGGPNVSTDMSFAVTIENYST